MVISPDCLVAVSVGNNKAGLRPEVGTMSERIQFKRFIRVLDLQAIQQMLPFFLRVNWFLVIVILSIFPGQQDYRQWDGKEKNDHYENCEDAKVSGFGGAVAY